MTRRGWIRSGILAAITAMGLVLAGCSGGGGGMSSNDSGSPGAPALGPTVVDISLIAAKAPVSTASPVPAGGSAVPTADSGYRRPSEIRELGPEIAHVYMEIVKVSLMPAEEAFEGEGTEGDIDDGDHPEISMPPDKPRFVSIVPSSPVVIDLLQLENGKKLAGLLNRFDKVPSGTYDKIRVWYRNASVVLQDGSALRFLPAARSKFDIRFRKGLELVIPAAMATTPPEGWFNYFRVKLTVEGIKIKVVRVGRDWRGCRVILRPLIFAETVPPTVNSVTGTADQVQVGSRVRPVYGSFNVLPGGTADNVAVAFDDNTVWAWSDHMPAQSGRTVAVSNDNGARSLRNGAIVEVVGHLDPAGTVFQAEEIRMTFPNTVTGNVLDGWNEDHFFQLQLTGDMYEQVYPQPNWVTAYYDHAVAPFGALTRAAIVDGAVVTARGYPGAFGGVEAYWISVGP